MKTTPASPRRRPFSAIAAAAAAVAFALAGPVAAQNAKYENPSQGYRISVNKKLEPVPTEPNERQILAKWGAKLEFKDKAYRGTSTCTLMLVQIARAKAATTGEKPEDEKDDKDEEKTTLREDATRLLNSGTTIEEFLARRGWRNDLQPVENEKPLKSKDGRAFVAKQLLGQTFDDRKWEVKDVPALRVYVLENASEYFGLISLGPFAPPFSDMVLDAVKSLERIETGASEAASTDESLANKGFRDQVRAKLVKGWSAYDTPHFIFVTNSKNKTLIDQLLVDIEIMRKAYLERFPPIEGVDMEAVISAVRFCDTYEDYWAYGGPQGTSGYWNLIDEELVIIDTTSRSKETLKYNPQLKDIKPLAVLYHEAMHQYFYYANGNLAPASWFNEGFGEVFGGSAPDRKKGTIGRIDRNRFRLHWIKQCQRLGRWPSLVAFLKMVQPEFYGPSAMQNYAFAWAFCAFLEEHRLDPKGNKLWGDLADKYLRNLRQATKEQREKLGIDEKDKKWLLAYQFDIQKVAYERTFADVDLFAIEEAWIDAMKKWK